MSIVKRLLSGPSNVDCLAAADLLKQQSERIKELEATLDRLYRVGHCGSVDSFLACDDEVKRGYFAMMVEESTDNKKLREKLAALRQRIADAPVADWIDEDEPC